MLREALDGLHPYGWTSRRSFRIALFGLVAYAALLFLTANLSLVPERAAVLLIIPAFVILVLLTVRRLRDARLSVYWALLMLVPVRLFVDLATVELGGVELRFIDFNQILFLVPILIGLLAPGRPAAQRTL